MGHAIVSGTTDKTARRPGKAARHDDHDDSMPWLFCGDSTTAEASPHATGNIVTERHAPEEERDMEDDTMRNADITTTRAGTPQPHATTARCVMVLHDIDTSIGTLMEMNDQRFTRWVQGGKATKLIHIMDDDAATHDIDGCYAHDIIDGHMMLNATLRLPDAIIGKDGTWHDRPADMDDDDWKCTILAAILGSDTDCRVSFVGVK